MASVLQSWVENLTLMQQSVLLAAVRGPDGIRKEHPTKHALRWYRRCILIAAFEGRVLDGPFIPGGGNFTGPVPLDMTDENIIDTFIDHLDELPFHAVTHFMFAVEILGYKHPVNEIRFFWLQFYLRLVKKLNLTPESPTELDYRLGDKENQWKEKS